MTVRATLNRDDEPPAQALKTLPDLISIDQSRALARRLLEPCWKVVAELDDSTKYRYLESLLPADPAGVLEKLQSLKFNNDVARLRLLREAVLVLAERDQEEAASVAESIADPATRSWAFVHLADRIPASQRDRKLALLDRALEQARIATGPNDRLTGMGDVALRWLELGQTDKAKALFAEGKKIANQLTEKTDLKRGMFAAVLARVDLPAAEAIVRDAQGSRDEPRVLGKMAFNLAESSFGDAERPCGSRRPANQGGWSLGVSLSGGNWAGSSRPRDANTEESPNSETWPSYYFYLALGRSARRSHLTPVISNRIARAGPYHGRKSGEHVPDNLGLLPVVEQIDPALVPEIFWHHVASRLPYGDPRGNDDAVTAYLTEGALRLVRPRSGRGAFAPTLARIGANRREPCSPPGGSQFLAWSAHRSSHRSCSARTNSDLLWTPTR